jgi:hypothetical protein
VSPIREDPSDPSLCREELLSSTYTSNDLVHIEDEVSRLLAPPGCSLGSVSSMFLAHFVGETSRYMTTVSPEKNPFLTHILPMAFSEELILHSLLALGGAHLESRRSSPEINTWVCRHYGKTIHLLQDTISRNSNEPIDWLRASLALLMLYLLGVFNSMQSGGAILHIRAGKKVIPRLLSASSKLTSMRTICGITFELYTYLSLITTPTPYDNGTSSELDTRNSLLLPWELLKDHGSFGVIISPIHRCLEIIPHVVALCTRRQSELTFNECSSESLILFTELMAIIDTIGCEDDSGSVLNGEVSQSLSISAVYRHALTIFAYDAMWCGAIAGDDSRLSIVRQHALSALTLLPTLMDTHYRNLLLWPTIVIGSCLLNDGEFDVIRSGLSIRQPIFVITKMRMMLEKLWAENDPVYFGPYGLQKLMMTHETVIYLA